LGKIWSRRLAPLQGGYGPGSSSCHASIGSTKSLARVAPGGRRRYSGYWSWSAPRLKRMRSPAVFLRRPLRTGKPGPPTRCTLFNAPRQRWRVATVASRNCITISEDSQRSGPRCGRCCITSTVTRRMVRHPPRAVSGGRSRISSKQCYRILRPCLNREGANTKSH
jgi:hypothetical protein